MKSRITSARSLARVVVVVNTWFLRGVSHIWVFTERKLDWHGGKLYATELMARLIARRPLFQKLSRVTLV